MACFATSINQTLKKANQSCCRFSCLTRAIFFTTLRVGQFNFAGVVVKLCCVSIWVCHLLLGGNHNWVYCEMKTGAQGCNWKWTHSDSDAPNSFQCSKISVTAASILNLKVHSVKDCCCPSILLQLKAIALRKYSTHTFLYFTKRTTGLLDDFLLKCKYLFHCSTLWVEWSCISIWITNLNSYLLEVCPCLIRSTVSMSLSGGMQHFQVQRKTVLVTAVSNGHPKVSAECPKIVRLWWSQWLLNGVLTVIYELHFKNIIFNLGQNKKMCFIQSTSSSNYISCSFQNFTATNDKVKCLI